MKIRNIFLSLSGMALPGATVFAKENKKPNIIFILADDLGYGDVSCLNENGIIHTPNIDRNCQIRCDIY